MWNRLCVWLGFSRAIQDWETEVKWVCMLAKKKAGLAEVVSNVFGMLVYVIWRERNKIRFQKGSMNTDEVLKEIPEIVMHMHIKSQTRVKWIALQQLNVYP